MTKQFRLFGSMILAGTLFLSACSNEDETSGLDPKPQEFIATDDSFSGFQTWELVADHQGPDPALGAAHAGNDSTVTRYVYFKDDQDRVNGSYPVGTIIVKESYNPDMTVHEFTAMAKRGHDFNPSGGNWEWFVLAGDGQIATDGDGNALRGADLMGGMCIGCHSQASGRDFAFSKQ